VINIFTFLNIFSHINVMHFCWFIFKYKLYIINRICGISVNIKIYY